MNIFLLIVVLIPFTISFLMFPRFLKLVEKGIVSDFADIKKQIIEKKSKKVIVVEIVLLILQCALCFLIALLLVALAALFIGLSAGYVWVLLQGV